MVPDVDLGKPVFSRKLCKILSKIVRQWESPYSCSCIGKSVRADPLCSHDERPETPKMRRHRFCVARPPRKLPAPHYAML